MHAGFNGGEFTLPAWNNGMLEKWNN